MRLSIRSARADEEKAVIALWQTCGLVVSPNDPVVDFRVAKQGACSDVIVATDGEERIVGVAMVGHDGHRGFIHYVASDPAARGRGIGRRVVEAAEAWIHERHIRRMHLMVRETNTQVMPFYEKLGFKEMGYRVMSKWLDGTQ